MKTAGPVHMVPYLEHTDGTMSGQLAVGGDQASGFHIWLGLIERLGRAQTGSG